MSDNEKQQSVEERLNELEFLVGASNLLDTWQVIREIRVATLAIIMAVLNGSSNRYANRELEAEKMLRKAREQYDAKNAEDESSE